MRIIIIIIVIVIIICWCCCWFLVSIVVKCVTHFCSGYFIWFYFFTAPINSCLTVYLSSLSRGGSWHFRESWLLLLYILYSLLARFLVTGLFLIFFSLSDVIYTVTYLSLRHMEAHHTNTIKIIKHLYIYTNTLKESSKEGNIETIG